MSQAPMPVPNGSGRAVRLGFNAGIQAAQTLCYGPDDPLVKGWSVAGMFWADSTNNIVKQLTQDGTTWVNVGTLDPTTGIVTWTNTTGITAAGASMSGALKFAAPVGITSVTGVLTLTDASNSFVVAGNEAITSITGWAQGIAYIRWSSARTLTYSNNLLLQNGINRTTQVNDIGIYEIVGNIVREINYFPALSSGIKSSFPLGLGNYIANGVKINTTNALSISTTTGTVVINNTPVDIGANSVTLDPRGVNLLYALSDGSMGAVKGKIPLDFVDDNTIGFWVFNQKGAGASIPNSAVGVSAIAVANDLVPHGGISSVDGWTGYAIKLDGTSGYYTGSNTTNFPSGTAEFEHDYLLTVDKINSSVLMMIFNYGTATTANRINMYISTSGHVMFNNYLTSDYDSGFVVSAGNTYLITLLFDGTYLYSIINGVLVYKTAITLSIIAATLYVGNGQSLSNPAGITLHYLEVRNKMRTSAQIGAIANKLMIPCFYGKPRAEYPPIPSAYTATYHEYRFDETSGTAVADSNTTSPLNGTATGTTIVDSDLSLGKARKLNGTSDSVSLTTNLTGTGDFTIAVVLRNKNKSQTTSNAVFSNGGMYSSSSAGIGLSFTTNGYRWSEFTGDSSPTGKYVDFTGSSDTDCIIISSPAAANTTTNIYFNSDKNPIVFAKNYARLSPSKVFAIGNEAGVSAYGNFEIDYMVYIPAALPQAEITKIYNSLMATGRRNIIDDVVPTNAVAVAFVRTSSTAVLEYNDSWPMYGRREKAVGGNRKFFLQYVPVVLATDYSFANPFNTENVTVKQLFKKNLSDKQHTEIEAIYSVNYGSTIKKVAADKIVIRTGENLLIPATICYTGSSETSGYIGLLVEMAEDFVGVQ